MPARWRCPCVSLALLLAYTVGSLLFLSPPRDPVGAINGAAGTSTTWAPRIRSAAGVDSIVFIALGPAARSASLLYALSSLREEGRWDGPVHVIVEREGDLDCLSSHLRSGVTTIAVVPPDAGDGGGGGGGEGGGVGGDDSDDGDETKMGTSDREGVLARKEGRGSVGGGGGGGGGVGGDSAGGKSAEGGGVAINAKLIKMQLFDLLPANVQRVVYVDCDVITQRPLGPYLAAVAREWGDVDEKAAAIAGAAVTVDETATAREKNQELAVLPAGSSSPLRAREGRAVEGPRLPQIPFPPSAAASAADTPASRASPAAASAAAAAAAGTKGGIKGGTAAAAAAAAAAGVPSTLLIFPDAGGHTFPVCAGCDVAHSGVVALARGHSELCLQLWHDAFVGKNGGGSGSGGGVRGGGGGGGDNTGTATDQEALDIALRKGSGCKARWVDRGHLHFMKDLFVMAGLTRTSTFAHFTGLLHPERLSSFYRCHYEWSLGRSVDEWGQGEIRACAAGW